YKRSPAGGELRYPNTEFEKMVASHWATEAKNFGLTFMITEQWPRWTDMDAIRRHGMACGYKFRVTEFAADAKQSRVTVTNTGVAPIYYDAYVTVNGVRARESLKYLQPGETRQFTIESGGTAPDLTIECGRLVPGQRIEFDADLN
ncbi:MAG: hypothetical protein KJZ78_22910, partial [Bryobacteraceae bacterium]|nr:hypothetical protein [Bryobacteraceae bacterium]